MLEYLKIVEDRLNDMFSIPSIIRIINNTNQKESAHDELKCKRESEDPRHADAILDPFKFTEKEKVKTEEPHETISETMKLKCQKAGTIIKVLSQNNLPTRLSVLLAQRKARNNSYKLKAE